MARRRSRQHNPLGALVGLALLAALAAAGWLWWQWHGWGPLRQETTVEIPEGASIASAGRLLQKQGVIRSSIWFHRFAARFGSHDPIRAGEYGVPAHASAARVLDILQHGKPFQRLVTVPEGMPSILVRDTLAAAPVLTGSIVVPAEGSILPDSYAYRRGETRAAVVARMQTAMTKELASLWAQRAPNIAVHSPREAIILASIVEKETGVASERPMVAAVYSNRLKANMPLQADPTVIYPNTQGRPLGRRILASELHAQNGYNTYAMRGLPAGPIANPGRAAIAAVLHPAASRALYFVANGQGGHVFATTLAEHNANVQKWYAIRRARGQM